MGKTYVQGEVLNAADLNASFLELKTLPINTQTATYTLVLTDLGTVISATGSVDIPASVFASGGTVSIFNNSTGVINIVQASGLTLYNASTGVAGSFTLNSRGICSVIFVSPTVAVLTGVGVSVTASGTLQGPVGPAGTASISAGSAAAPSIAPSTDTNTGMFFPAADTIAFAEGGAEAMRIDSSGRVGIGTTTPTQKVSIAGALSFNSVASYSGSGYEIGKDGADFLCFSSGSAGARFINTTTATEFMRIDSSGRVMTGCTSPTFASSTFKFSVTEGITIAPFGINNNAAGSDASNISIFARNGTQTGAITVTGTTTAYNTSSDYRLKDNVQPMTGALAKVALLKPCTYQWKADGSDGEGFIAHELAEVCHHAVFGEKDATNDEGEIIAQSVDASFLIATLTAAMQEQQAMITALTARITALEATP